MTLLGPARRHKTDDVRLHHAAGRLAHAEVAIFRVAAQAAVEIFLAQMAGDESMLASRLGFGARSRPCMRALGRTVLIVRVDDFGFALGFAFAMSASLVWFDP